MIQQGLKQFQQALNLKRRWVLAIVLLWVGFALRAGAQCVPTSATIFVSGDDVNNVWFNGASLGTFNYVSKGSGTVPPSLVFSAAQLALINSSGTNCLAVRNTNTICCEMSVAWVLDITCSNGQHSYMTSDQSGFNSYYWDITGAATPPNDAGGKPWTNPNWANPAPGTYFKDTPVCLNEFFWAKRIYDPLTGQWACALAPMQNENLNPLNDSYFRECEPISMVPPPPPPNFTLTKSVVGPSSGINTSQAVTYQVVACNSGGAVTAPVTFRDNLAPGFNYDGPYSPGPPQGPYVGGSPPLFVYSEGFPGNGACVTFQYLAVDYSVQLSDYCQVRTNTVSVLGYSGTSSAAVTMYCPEPTASYTPTPTYTFTPTWTNTLPPGTDTPTPTYTYTPLYTFTPTWTVTNTYTPVPGSCRLPSFRAASKLACLVMPAQKEFRQAGFGPLFCSSCATKSGEGSNREGPGVKLGNGCDLVSGFSMVGDPTKSNLLNDYSHPGKGVPWPDGSPQGDALFVMTCKGYDYAHLS